MEKSTDVLNELKEVIGSHADLSEFTDFVKAFIKKKEGATIQDAAKAWKVKKPKANDKEKDKLNKTLKVDPALPGAAPGVGVAADPNAAADPDAADEGEEGEASDTGEGYVNDPVTPAVDPNAAASAALTGPGGAAPERGLAELSEKGYTISEADVAMHNWIEQHEGR